MYNTLKFSVANTLGDKHFMWNPTGFFMNEKRSTTK